MSEYRQRCSKRSYPGKHKKGSKGQVRRDRIDTDVPGFGVDMDSWQRRMSNWYGKGKDPRAL